MSGEFERLKKTVLDFIRTREQDLMRLNPRDFESLAMEVYRWQYHTNGLYGGFCDAQEGSPDRVHSLAEIPAVPTSAFKNHHLFCFPVSQADGWFETSGTTDGRPGVRFYRDTSLYEATWPTPFQLALVPENSRIPMASLIPRLEDAPHSSLAFMIDRALRKLGDVHSSSFAGLSPDWAGFLSWLDQAAKSAEPVLLLGTSFSWVFFLDEVKKRNLKGWPLPVGSRLMETGGYKGRSREVPRSELRAQLTEVMGLSEGCVIGEYGMTELSSQFYEKRVCDQEGVGAVFGANPWAAAGVVDPWSGEVILPADAADHGSRRGLLRIFDLGNLDSVMAIQTEDMAELYSDGSFRLEGRASGAELRGCSLDTERIWEETAGG